MANSEDRTSSDAVPASGCDYQVFLSFRGPDTRHGFTDFLYNSLVDVGVRVFRDDEELHVGEVISENLLNAINNSIIYIPIFSRTYASSKWCLRELVHIVDNESKSKDEKCIFPIFFDVEPDDVKLKTSIYNNALSEYEGKFPEEVVAWRAALAEVGKIKGLNVISSQAKIVESVVEKVLEKLETKEKLVPEDLIGLDDRITDLTKLLNVNHHDVRLIAIYGMGGIGKSTVAKVIFNQLSRHFGKCCSFLDDVRENSLTKEDIVQLQKKLLSDIIGANCAEQINDSEQGMRRIGKILRSKKVLVVLDDVVEEQHIKKLIGNSSLHPGSRIIITTRDQTIPSGFNGQILRYEMLEMDDTLALQLFCRHAFGENIPSNDYHELSSEIVSGMGGLPLAIEVIGSSLKIRDKAVWKETLDNIKMVPKGEILNKLKISYNGLEKYHKEIFLDIACFFNKNTFNNKKTDAIYMWTSCRFQPQIGIQVLIERCLIKILDNDKFWMHDQLIDLGRQIVCEESQDDLGERSRLWIAEDTLQIIGTGERKPKVKALEISTNSPPIEITNEDFENLPNLRFLNLNRGTFVGDFARYHSKLRWFSWTNNYLIGGHLWNKRNLDFRADNLHLDQLVVCKLSDIDFKDDSKAWDFIKGAEHLKVLSISHCYGITTIPDISRCLVLERLTLFECIRLKRIESFIGNLQSLIELKIIACRDLTDLPEELGKLGKLQCFSLHNCNKLIELPGSLGNLTSLTELDLFWTMIRELPNSIGNLTSLTKLDLAGTKIRELPNFIGNFTSLTKLDLSGTMIRELPNSIGQLKSLRILHFSKKFYSIEKNHDWQLPSGINTLENLEELILSGHEGMKGEIPIEIGEWSSLRILDLCDTRIGKIPRTINKLHQLQSLHLSNCNEIQELPELPKSLTTLHFTSKSLLSIPNLSKLTNLDHLSLVDGSFYRGKSNLIPGCNLSWIGNLSRLEYLELGLLNILAPPELASLSNLEYLMLHGLDLKSLMQLPSPELGWKNLSNLVILRCEVEDIPLDGLSQLVELKVSECNQLKRLSIASGLRMLQKVEVQGCQELVEIQVVGVLKWLSNLVVDYCESLTTINGLSYLKNLGFLDIRRCHVLTSVEGLNEIESLEELSVSECTSLRRLIDASCTKIPDDCDVWITKCGYFVKTGTETYLKNYREEILRSTSNEISFTIRFHLAVKKSVKELELFGSVCAIEREKEGVDPDSVTYEGLIADTKNFGFLMKRMWYEDPCTLLPREIQRNGHVNEMLEYASRQGFYIDLFVEGGVDSDWEGEYDDKMMEMLREEQKMKTDAYSGEDGARWLDVSCPNEGLNFAPVGGESETHGNSPIDDFQLKRGNAECFEATTSIAEKDLGSVKKQVEEPRDEETITLKRCGEEVFPNILNKGKRQRDDDPIHPHHNLELNLELNLGPTCQVKSKTATQGKRQRKDDHAPPHHNKELNLEFSLWPADWHSSASYKKDNKTSGKNTTIG